jgi:hypothetical protein
MIDQLPFYIFIVPFYLLSLFWPRADGYENRPMLFGTKAWFPWLIKECVSDLREGPQANWGDRIAFLIFLGPFLLMAPMVLGLCCAVILKWLF